MDAILAGLPAGMKPGLLLHSCCGPCSSSVLERLIPYFDVTLLYYNPNVQPEAEYQKRLETQRQLLREYPEVKELSCGYMTAQLAKEHGFSWFCTTLTVSPHKDAEVVNTLGEEAGGRFGVAFLPSDFKKKDGYSRSIELSKKFGLYRQSYCGCKYSSR